MMNYTRLSLGPVHVSAERDSLLRSLENHPMPVIPAKAGIRLDVD
jgi:hypothetical protein